MVELKSLYAMSAGILPNYATVAASQSLHGTRIAMQCGALFSMSNASHCPYCPSNSFQLDTRREPIVSVAEEKEHNRHACAITHRGHFLLNQ